MGEQASRLMGEWVSGQRYMFFSFTCPPIHLLNSGHYMNRRADLDHAEQFVYGSVL